MGSVMSLKFESAGHVMFLTGIQQPFALVSGNPARWHHCSAEAAGFYFI